MVEAVQGGYYTIAKFRTPRLNADDGFQITGLLVMNENLPLNMSVR